MNEKINRYKEDIRNGQGTIMIMVINLVAFIGLHAIPGLDENLLLSSDVQLVMTRPWTLMTVFFSHAVHLHLILNMVLLFIFGMKLEKMTNSKLLVMSYALAGFAGSLVHVPISVYFGTQGLTAGASAAVFGIVTAYTVIDPETTVLRSKAKWWALALLMFNVITFILNPRESVGAISHIAGIVVGAAIGFLVRKNHPNHCNHEAIE